MTPRKIFLPLMLAGSLFLAACGADEETASNSNQSAPAQSESSPAPSESTPAAESGGGEGGPIEIKDFKFPTETKVAVGDSIEWTNADSTFHTVTFKDKSIKSIQDLDQGEKGTVKFEKAGTYEYYCEPHPFMKSKVIVE